MPLFLSQIVIFICFYLRVFGQNRQRRNLLPAPGGLFLVWGSDPYDINPFGEGVFSSKYVPSSDEKSNKKGITNRGGE